METLPAAPISQPIIVSAPETATNTIAKYGIGAIVVGLGLWKLRSMYLEAQANKEADQSTTDTNSNAAEQLHELIDTSWGARFLGTKDSAVLDILPQVTDIEAVKAKYKTLTQGSDLIEDMRKGMKSSNFTKAMNILGVKAGIIKPISDTGKKASLQTAGLFAIAKVDSRVRKSPVLKSTLSTQNNVIGVAQKGQVVGITAGKPVLDPANNVFFIPIKIILSDSKIGDGFVAVSNVDLFPKRPPEATLFTPLNFIYANTAAPLSGPSTNLTSLLI